VLTFHVGSRKVLQMSSLSSPCGRRKGCRKCAMNGNGFVLEMRFHEKAGCSLPGNSLAA
jgi:hypothetical protein